MLLGHYAVALAAKRAAPRTSLGTLTAAAQWTDLIWPLLLLLGWESVRIDPGNTAFTPLAFDRYPFTHSMVAALVWGVIFGGVYAWRTGRSRAAVWLGLTVFSHWVLDWVTHRADLQLAPGMPFRTGLGLWNSVPGTLAVEVAMWIVGISARRSSTCRLASFRSKRDQCEARSVGHHELERTCQMLAKPAVLLRIEGAAMLACSLFLYHSLGARWAVFFALCLWPDLFMLGYLANAKLGARLYNLVHMDALRLWAEVSDVLQDTHLQRVTEPRTVRPDLAVAGGGKGVA